MFNRYRIRMMETVHQNLVNQLSEITISKPADIKLQPQNGEIMVKKGSGKTKIRKGQTEEEFQEQKRLFHQTGPMLNTKTWLEEIDVSSIDPNVKSDRAKLENLTERLYFKREYAKCLQTTNFALDLFKELNPKKIKNEIEELEYLKVSCTKKLETVEA